MPDRRGDGPRWPGVVGAVLAGLGVALGAFGAHALEGVLTPARLATFETAVRYQVLHGIALVALRALWAGGVGSAQGLRWACVALAVGAVVFAGSLYLIVATDVGAWGAVAPVGGAAMIAGWGAAAWALARPRGS